MELQEFVEVETPFLMPSTPEGAREFLVPSRKEPGSFYALPQSPQLWKQLLMVAGVDRYFQIARCLRDEDLRADRQYEFMQLDAEMSFVTQPDVLAAIGKAVTAAAEAATGVAVPPIEQITWHEAMNRFGVDKPDLRFGLELHELTDIFAATEFKAFSTAASIKGIRVDAATYPEQAASGRGRLDALTDRAKQVGAKGLVWLRVAEGKTFESPVAKFISATESAALCDRFGAVPGDLILIVADEWDTTCEVLGQLRNDIGRPPVHEGPYRYVWVIDFPLFVGIDAVTVVQSQGIIRFAIHIPTTCSISTQSHCGYVHWHTTSCLTVGNLVQVPFVSMSLNCKGKYSTSWALAMKKPIVVLGSSCNRLNMALHHTVALHLVSTV